MYNCSVLYMLLPRQLQRLLRLRLLARRPLRQADLGKLLCFTSYAYIYIYIYIYCFFETYVLLVHCLIVCYFLFVFLVYFMLTWESCCREHPWSSSLCMVVTVHQAYLPYYTPLRNRLGTALGRFHRPKRRISISQN